uniref:DUF19 domain-containing protein n=1 Tax=Caenorhabditis tropicalis TaxID=1561998 RepID=A0A1I7T7T2_9PELO
MIFILMFYNFVVFSDTQSTDNPLDCDFLADSFEYEDYSGNVQNYTGECCTPQAVANLTNRFGNSWKTLNRKIVVPYAYNYKLCQNYTTTTPIPSTTPLDCGFLSADCCNADAVDYLNKNKVAWRIFPLFASIYETELKEKGLCGKSTTSKLDTSSGKVARSRVPRTLQALESYKLHKKRNDEFVAK